MSRNKTALFIIILFFLAIALATFYFYKSVAITGVRLDNFAKCLASKDITMYGAVWCSHCQSEKNAFGDSFKYVPYVECPDDPQKCLSLGITGYPTWILPDGKRLLGEQGIEKLSQESGCVL